MKKRLLRLAAIAAVAVLSVVGLGLYARYVEPYAIRVDEVTIAIPGLPPALEALDVVLIADLHVEGFGRRERRLVEILEELDPDVLLVAGDYVQNAYHMSDYLGFVAGACSVFAALDPSMRVVGVFGNNDEPEVMREPLAAVGVEVLENRWTRLDLPGGMLTIAGLGDPVTGKADWASLMAPPPPAPMLLLAHSPDAFGEARRRGVPVLLCGHTHGGQVRHPFMSLDPARFLRLLPGTPPYRAGRYERDGSTLYVNRGIGMTHLALRFLCPPEVTRLRLVPRVEPSLDLAGGRSPAADGRPEGRVIQSFAFEPAVAVGAVDPAGHRTTMQWIPGARTRSTEPG